MNLFELSWRATQQIAIVDEGHELAEGIDGWGSGFFIKYKGIRIFVTADHVVHYDDHDSSNEYGKRIGKDDHIFIITNVTDVNNQIGFQEIGGIYNFDEYKFPDLEEELTEDEIELYSIPDMKDCAFSFIDENQSFDIRTHDLNDIDSSEIVPKGIRKIFIPDEQFNLGSPSEICLVTGTVMNKLEVLDDGRKQINRGNVIHLDLMFSGKVNNDGDYIYNAPDHDRVLNSLWKGLSGAPAIGINGKLVGIIVRAVCENNTIIVKPITEVLKYIDYAMTVEHLIN